MLRGQFDGLVEDMRLLLGLTDVVLVAMVRDMLIQVLRAEGVVETILQQARDYDEAEFVAGAQRVVDAATAAAAKLLQGVVEFSLVDGLEGILGLSGDALQTAVAALQRAAGAVGRLAQDREAAETAAKVTRIAAGAERVADSMAPESKKAQAGTDARDIAAATDGARQAQKHASKALAKRLAAKKGKALLSQGLGSNNREAKEALREHAGPSKGALVSQARNELFGDGEDSAVAPREPSGGADMRKVREGSGAVSFPALGAHGTEECAEAREAVKHAAEKARQAAVDQDIWDDCLTQLKTFIRYRQMWAAAGAAGAACANRGAGLTSTMAIMNVLAPPPSSISLCRPPATSK